MAISEKQLKDDYTEWSTKGHKFLRTSETGRAALRGKIPEEWFQSVMRQIHYNVHRDIDVDEYLWRPSIWQRLLRRWEEQ